MAKNLGRELLLYLLLKTGLRLGIISKMLGVGRDAVQTRIANTALVKHTPPFSKGMLIQPDGFMRFRFKSLIGYVFMCVYRNVKDRIQNKCHAMDKAALDVLSFTLTYELFQEIYRARFEAFTSTTGDSKQITASQLWQFVRFFETGCVGTMVYKCGLTRPVSLNGRTFCSCQPPKRSREYWIDFNREIDQAISDIEEGAVVRGDHIDARLQQMLLEASCVILGVAQQPA